MNNEEKTELDLVTGNEEAATPRVADGTADNGAGEERDIEGFDAEAASDKDFNDYIHKIREAEAADEANTASEDNPEEENDGDGEEDENPDNEKGGQDNAANEKLFTQSDVDRIIQKRLAERNHNDRTALKEFDALGEEAVRFYGGTRESAIAQMLKDLRQQNADTLGVDEERYSDMREVEKKAQLYDEQQTAEQKKQEEIAAIQKRWQTQTEEIREIVPDFDFNKAMKNKTFYDAIMAGKSVQAAFMTANKQTVTKQQQEKTPRKGIMQNAAAAASAGAKADFDPISASDADFNDYIRKIKNQ